MPVIVLDAPMLPSNEGSYTGEMLSGGDLYRTCVVQRMSLCAVTGMTISMTMMTLVQGCLRSTRMKKTLGTLAEASDGVEGQSL